MARKTNQIYPSVIASPARRGPALIWGDFTLGAAGAIASATGFFPITTTAGTFGVIKTAAKTGRYSFVTDRKYRTLRVVSVDLVGPADAAITNATANLAFSRNVTGNGFDVQLAIGLNAGGSTDTDGMSGLVVTFIVAVETYGGKS